MIMAFIWRFKRYIILEIANILIYSIKFRNSVQNDYMAAT